MSNYSEFIKTQVEKDRKFFYGESYKKVTNKYFTFENVIDEDNIIVFTNNIARVKGNYVMIVDNNKAVYLKSWQIRQIRNYYMGIDAYAVKLNRKYFRPYTFSFDFEGFSFDEEDTFESLVEVAKEQQAEKMSFAEGWEKDVEGSWRADF